MSIGLLTINEAARRLGLNPQTVYRKCKRGELPFRRYGRTLRIPEDVLFGGTVEKSAFPVSLPSFMNWLFWDTNVSKLTSNDSIVIERILELGDLAEVQWLLRNVPRDRIRQFIDQKGIRRLSPKSLHFWITLIKGTHEPERPTPESAETLGKTRWR